MRLIGLAVVLAVSLTLAPLAAEAQPPGKVYRMGYLYSGSATSSPRAPEAFRKGLRELGWVEGRNIVIDYRFAEGRFDRLPDLAAELVRLKVNVIVLLYLAEGVYGVATTGQAKSSAEIFGGLALFGMGPAVAWAGLRLAGLRLTRGTPR